jgi:hypothetical protein
MELMTFVNPTLKKTVISQEAAEFLGIRSAAGPGGVSFGPIQIYLMAAVNGRAQSFRVTPEHSLGGPLIFGRDLLSTYRMTQGTGQWAVMSVSRVLLDEAPNQGDDQGCEQLLIPLGAIKREAGGSEDRDDAREAVSQVCNGEAGGEGPEDPVSGGGRV